MEELKEELEALKMQLLHQGEELEKLRSNPSSPVQDGTSTQSMATPSIPRGPMETIMLKGTSGPRLPNEEPLPQS